MLPVARKDVLPTTQKSSVVYEFKCHCDSWYVGQTSQRVQDHIEQHVPQLLRQRLTRLRRSQFHRSCKRKDTEPDSAIGQYLLENDQCTLNCDDKRFSILATARSSFHLNLLEAAYIRTQRPTLSKQRVCLHSQTFSIIIAAFGLLPRLLRLSLLRNLSLARFTILAPSFLVLIA